MTEAEREIYGLEGRDLDVAVAEKVLEITGYAVTEEDPEADPEPGELDHIRWKPATSAEAEAYPENRKRVACRPYSAHMGTAWDVVEMLRLEGFMPVVKHMPDDHPFKIQGDPSEYGGGEPTRDMRGTEGQAIAEFYPVSDSARERVDVLGANLSARADRPSVAICRAALLTVREVGDEW